MIALDLPNQRVYIRGNAHHGYSWLKERWKENWANVLCMHTFPMTWLHLDRYCEDHEWIACEGWTIEHNPEPVNMWLADGFMSAERL